MERLKASDLTREELLGLLLDSQYAVHRVNDLHPQIEKKAAELKRVEEGLKISRLGRGGAYAYFFTCLLIGFVFGWLVCVLLSGGESMFIIAFVLGTIISLNLLGRLLMASSISNLGVEKKEKIEKELQSLTDELNAVATSPVYKQMKRVVPSKYASPEVLLFLYDAVNDSRADTLKEAINLYETERHFRELEQQLKDQKKS